MADWLKKFISYQEDITDRTDKDHDKKGVSVLSVGNNTINENSFEKDEISIEKIKSLAGEDWESVRKNSVIFDTIKQIAQDRHLMHQGKVPKSYRYQSYCKSCGPVPLDIPGHVLGCPWCLLGSYKKIRNEINE